MRSLTLDSLVELVPSVRDRAELERDFPSRDREWIAHELVRRAVNSSGRVGLGGGIVAASGYFTPRWIRKFSALVLPAQLGAETAAISIIEIKLTAELHALYGLVDAGTLKERAALWVTAWAKGSAVTVHDEKALRSALTKFGESHIKRQLARRARRNLLSFLPFPSGAAIARWANRKQTREFARAMHASVRSVAGA